MSCKGTKTAVLKTSVKNSKCDNMANTNKTASHTP